MRIRSLLAALILTCCAPLAVAQTYGSAIANLTSPSLMSFNGIALSTKLPDARQYTGYTVFTSDQGLMVSDGVAWHAMATNLPSIVNNTVLGNISGITATATAVPLGSAIGSILGPLNNFDGGGHPGLSLTDGLKLRRPVTGATDFADLLMSRSANYTSASNTFVNSAFRSGCVIAATAGSYEWCGLFTLDNSADRALASQNVGLASVAQMRAGAGPTWAMFGQIKDYSGGDPTSGVVGLELGINADGTDATTNRLILHVVGGTLTGVAPTIHTGISVSAQAGSGATFDRELALGDLYTTGVYSDGGTAGAGSFLQDVGTHAYGLMLRGTYSSAAIYLKNNKGILWSDDQTIQTRWFSADSCLEDQLSQVAWHYSCNNGTVGVGSSRPPTGATAAPSFYLNTLGLPAPQFHFGVPVFLPSSGTFSTTPSAGGLTLTTPITNLPTLCSTTVGCYMYFPANAINGSNTAGAYFTTCTTTAVCSVFNNGLAGSGLIAGTAVPVTITSTTSFGTVAGGGYTQTTASSLTLVAVSVAANSMGPNGSISIDAQYARISNANSIVPQFVWFNQNLGSFSSASQQWIGMHRTLHNQGATNVQFAQSGSSGTDIGAINAAPTPIAVDTTIANTLLFRCNMAAAATDWCVLMSGDVMTNYAP